MSADVSDRSIPSGVSVGSISLGVSVGSRPTGVSYEAGVTSPSVASVSEASVKSGEGHGGDAVEVPTGRRRGKPTILTLSTPPQMTNIHVV